MTRRANSIPATSSRSPRAGRSPRPRTGSRPAWSKRLPRCKRELCKPNENGPQCGSFLFLGAQMIKVGDPLPDVTLQEYSEVEGEGCSLGPNPVKVAQSTAGKTIALFGLPGAFTPTCSAKHVPGFVQKADEFKKAGVDEIW